MSGDDVIQRLADAAERGYEPHQLKARPRAADLEAAADAHVEALDVEAIRLFGPETVVHEAYTGPLRWQSCGGCGKPWPCPDAPLTEREQDRLDDMRLDETEADRG